MKAFRWTVLERLGSCGHLRYRHYGPCHLAIPGPKYLIVYLPLASSGLYELLTTRVVDIPTAVR